jgi:pimeloyl-ACP methyl ester carboxylesterase
MRTTFLPVVLAAAVLTACSPLRTTGDAPLPSSARPIVLVHGAWSNAAVWDAVAADLRARGLAVREVELPGHGRDTTPPEQLTLQGYTDAVTAALPSSGQAVVVGHSMAGMVISNVAEQSPGRISTLVYVAAYYPANGESLYQLSQQDPDSHVGRYWTQADPAHYSPASIRAEGIADVFCADCTEDLKAQLVATHRAEAVPPLATSVALTEARFGTVPKVYVYTTQDHAVSYALQTRMTARGTFVRKVELATSHLPMLTRPEALADAIAQAAQR